MKSLNVKATVLVLVSSVLLNSLCVKASDTSENYKRYLCDYTLLSSEYSTITTTYNDYDITIVNKKSEDLEVINSEDKVIGYIGISHEANDKNSNSINVDDTFELNMQKKVGIFSIKYELKNNLGEVVAKAKFNKDNTGGEITDTSGNVIAAYLSSEVLNDYTAYIYENEICSDLTLLLIIASYVSDMVANS